MNRFKLIEIFANLAAEEMRELTGEQFRGSGETVHFQERAGRDGVRDFLVKGIGERDAKAVQRIKKSGKAGEARFRVVRSLLLPCEMFVGAP
ncbi:MAG TPA: hypothetical protein VF275_07375 [Gammaproteobacteria bacterium]